MAKHHRRVRQPTEFYDVKLNYLQPDYFWNMGHVETVELPIPSPAVEKDQHDQAAAVARKRFPGCDIVSVTYG
jgi:hypothetical protein